MLAEITICALFVGSFTVLFTYLAMNREPDELLFKGRNQEAEVTQSTKPGLVFYSEFNFWQQ